MRFLFMIISSLILLSCTHNNESVINKNIISDEIPSEINHIDIKNQYGIFSDNKNVYFYMKEGNSEKSYNKLDRIDPFSFQVIKKGNYDRTLSKIYFQDKNGLYFAHLSHKGIHYKKVLDNFIEIVNINYFSSTILDTGKYIIREGIVLDYVDYETLEGIGSVQEYQKDKNYVYDKSFDIIQDLNPDKTVDLGYDNKYYISDGNSFYLTGIRVTEEESGYEYENVILVKKIPDLENMYQQIKSFYDNGGY